MTHLAAVVLLELAVVSASPAVVEFDGETYVRAFSSNQPTIRLVEFIRDGETVENWTKLFAIRKFPTGTDPRSAVGQFQQVVKQHNPQAGVQVLVKEDGSEAMIDFLAWPKDADHMELNIHRYIKHPAYPGLISYQFAYRFRTTPDTTAKDIRELKDRWCELMREINPPVAFGK
jgi:hypothetical protein